MKIFKKGFEWGFIGKAIIWMFALGILIVIIIKFGDRINLIVDKIKNLF